MFVYGDYGQFSFDDMTWYGTVHNLQYDNIPYQSEKLSKDSREALTVFEETTAIDDIIEWAIDRIECNFCTFDDDTFDETKKIITNYLKNDRHSISNFEEKYPDLDYCTSIIKIATELIDAATDGEHEFIAKLRNECDTLQEFDEMCESSLWQAGRVTHQKYFICMYALEVCSQKLKAQNQTEE